MKVVVTNNNPQWPEMFETEANKLREVFGEELTVVHHIGSASVPGLKAKPIIDIMPLERHLAFRDFLRQHKEDALKETFAERFPNEIEAYMDSIYGGYAVFAKTPHKHRLSYS